jgi:hypothetical protein
VRAGSRPARARIVDASNLRGRIILALRTIVALRRAAVTLLRGLAVGTRHGFVTL